MSDFKLAADWIPPGFYHGTIVGVDWGFGESCTVTFEIEGGPQDGKIVRGTLPMRKQPAMFRQSPRRQRMTRDELIEEIGKGIREALPENVEEMDGDDLDAVTTAVNTVVNEACEAIDDAANEDEDDSLSEPTKQTE